MTDTNRPFEIGDVKGSPDPYALYQEARKGGAVQPSGSGWLVLGHREGEAVLRSNASRSGFIGEGHKSRLPPGAAREEMSNRINFIDPPRHAQVRGLISKAFTPRRTSQLRPFVEKISRNLLENLRADTPLDLIRFYAHEVPSLVISELLGVPVEEREVLTVLSGRVSRLLGAVSNPQELEDAVAAAEQMHAILRKVLDARRAQPQDDLLSALLAAKEGSERLTESELLSLAATLYSAGHRTTRDLFSNGLSWLLARPDLINRFRTGDLPVPAIVEEFLRYETPTHTIGRILIEPMEVGGQTISPGEPIFISLAAANRDPEVYEHADQFDPDRWTGSTHPPAPLSFALGAHFCLGASLARLEVAVMLEALFEVHPKISSTGEPLVWHHTGVFRGLDALPVLLGGE